MPSLDMKPNRLGSVSLAPADGFIDTDRIARLTERASAYMDAGYPVHLSGPAGTGKTTLAFHIAASRGRPVSLIHGNDSHNGTDLIGRDNGYRRSTTVDNFIHSVLKTEENVDVKWVNNRLTHAAQNGHTLIYDEFNRTRAEANNVLLSLLEEGILTSPRGDAGLSRVHPDFRMILTSNPAEYAGVHRAQDALLDRLITIRCEHYDAATEHAIVLNCAGISDTQASRIVALVRSLRGEDGTRDQPTVRAAIALARVCDHLGADVSAQDERFVAVAWDVLGDSVREIAVGDEPVTRDEFVALLTEVFAAADASGRRRDKPPPRKRRAAA